MCSECSVSRIYPASLRSAGYLRSPRRHECQNISARSHAPYTGLLDSAALRSAPSTPSTPKNGNGRRRLAQGSQPRHVCIEGGRGVVPSGRSAGHRGGYRRVQPPGRVQHRVFGRAGGFFIDWLAEILRVQLEVQRGKDSA